MKTVQLAWAFLRRRWGQAVLAVVVGALGVAAVETVMIAERELPKAAERAFGGVDMVIGPKGSALDLVLCCVLHVSDPRGLIPLKEGMELAHNPLIAAAAPIALGDSRNGWRIVGTRPDILKVYHARLAHGSMWTAPLQAVVGSAAAQALDLKVGGTFIGTHGLSPGGEEHSRFPYTITGILAPTGSALDRLILTDIESVYLIHRDPDDVAEAQAGNGITGFGPPAATAILASFRSPVAMASLPRMVDATERFSAASPALETARLARAGRPVIMAVMAVGVLFAAIAAATAATALAAAMSGRARDLALLRALGAHPWEIAAIAAAEACMLVAAAMVVGVAAVAALAPWAATVLAQRDGLLISVVPTGQDLALLALGALAAALVAAAGPAVRAARAPIETVLNA